MNENEEKKEDTNTSIWNAPFPLESSNIEGFVNENDSGAFPVLYMKNKLENMRENKKDTINEKGSTQNIFEQTNYKNIELFETIHESVFEPFKESLRRKPRGLKWKVKNLNKKRKNKRKNKTKKTSCATISQKTKNKKNPVKEFKRIYTDAFDWVAAQVSYRETPDKLSEKETGTQKSEKYISGQNSKWLKTRVGEYFVVIFTIIITFSTMFYSTETFKTKYSNPLETIKDIGKRAAFIKPIYDILEIFLKDVLAPFIFLLNVGLNIIPMFCNLTGLFKRPHIMFIILFGIFFGLIWEINKKFSWFLNMFLTSFKWKINGTMFILVFVNIFVDFVTEMTDPTNWPRSTIQAVIVLIALILRILIALLLVPIAQMFFGFGFLLLFFIFPVCIIFFKKSEDEMKNSPPPLPKLSDISDVFKIADEFTELLSTPDIFVGKFKVFNDIITPLTGILNKSYVKEIKNIVLNPSVSQLVKLPQIIMANESDLKKIPEMFDKVPEKLKNIDITIMSELSKIIPDIKSFGNISDLESLTANITNLTNNSGLGQLINPTKLEGFKSIVAKIVNTIDKIKQIQYPTSITEGIDLVKKITTAPCVDAKDEHIPNSLFPILIGIPTLLRFSKQNITENNGIVYDNTISDWVFNKNLKYQTNDPPLSRFAFIQLFLSRNVISIVFFIFFVTHLVNAAKFIPPTNSMFYIMYTIINAFVAFAYFLYVIVMSFWYHAFP